jgi:hypothetical protein
MAPARRLVPLAIFVVVVLSFLPALSGQFLDWDDRENLVRNTGYRGLGWAQLRWMATATVLGHYIPLTWLSFGVNYALGDLNPWGYHLLNLLLHGANAALFYFVARRLLAAGIEGATPQTWRMTAGAAFGALVFGVHPLRVESVAWITERRDVLCGLFFLLAILAWLRAIERPGGPDRRWQILSLAAFLASLLSKAVSMPLPFVLVLLDLYPLGRLRARGWKPALLEKLPHFALAAGAAVLALAALRISGVTVTSYQSYGAGARVAMIAYSLVFYPWKFLWPSGLSPLYELPARVDPLALEFFLPIIALIGVTAVLIVFRRQWPGVLAAWAYSAIMVLPVSGVVHAGYQLAHDRYSYLSGLGFTVLAGAVLAWVLGAGERGRLRPPIVGLLVATAALVVLTWSADSWRQSRIWRDSESLWRWAVARDPSCAVCRNNLGSAIIDTPPLTPGRVAEAEHQFRIAIDLRPERPGAYLNLATTLAMQKRYLESEAAFRDLIAKHPDLPLGPGMLGQLLMEEGRFEDAIPLLRQAQSKAPRARELQVALAKALRARARQLAADGRRPEAAALDREAGELEAEAQRSTTSTR